MNYDTNDGLLYSDRLYIQAHLNKQRLDELNNRIVILYKEWEHSFETIVRQAFPAFIEELGSDLQGRYLPKATQAKFNQCAHKLCQYCQASVNLDCHHNLQCLRTFMRASYEFERFVEPTANTTQWDQLISSLFEWEELTGLDANFGYYFYDCWTIDPKPYRLFVGSWDTRNVTDPEAIHKELQEVDSDSDSQSRHYQI